MDKLGIRRAIDSAYFVICILNTIVFIMHILSDLHIIDVLLQIIYGPIFFIYFALAILSFFLFPYIAYIRICYRKQYKKTSFIVTNIFYLICIIVNAFLLVTAVLSMADIK